MNRTHRTPTSWLLLLAILAILAAHARADDPKPAIDRYLRSEMQRQQIPGVSAALNRTADGSLYSTAIDLMKWDRALGGNGILPYAGSRLRSDPHSRLQELSKPHRQRLGGFQPAERSSAFATGARSCPHTAKRLAGTRAHYRVFDSRGRRPAAVGAGVSRRRSRDGRILYGALRR